MLVHQQSQGVGQINKTNTSNVFVSNGAVVEFAGVGEQAEPELTHQTCY
jgi:hypothetical protein